MPRLLVAGLAGLAFATTTPGTALPYEAGLVPLEIAGTAEAPTLEGFIWYPTEPPDAPTGFDAPFRFGENAVWFGFDAYPGRGIAPGRFPLVVLSHGLMGNAFNQAWLATALAEAGMIVVAPNHPGTTTANRDRAERARLWRRPQDLTRAITAVQEDPRFAPALLPERVTAIGHSLGGFTVLALAGARVDADRYDAYCDAHPERVDCLFYRSAGIGTDAASRAALEGPLADTRVTAAVSFDLGLTQAFDLASLRAIDLPVLVISAGDESPLIPLETESRALAAALPDVRYLEPSDLSHFVFLGLCKPGGEAILVELEPGDEIVCQEGKGRDRATLHTYVVDEVLAFLAGAAPATD